MGRLEVRDGTELPDVNRFARPEPAGWYALGNVMWQRAFARLGLFGTAHGAAEVPGGILVAGSMGVMKLDIGGNLVWARTYGNDTYVEISSLAAHADGSSVVAGRYSTSSRAWAMKLDPDGEVQWSRTHGGTEFARVRITGDGGYVLVGLTDSNVSDMLLVTLDPDGGVRWRRALGNRYDATGGEVPGATLASATDRGNDVVERPGGGYVAVGESYGAFPVPEAGQPGYYAAWVAEVDAQGEVVDSTVFRSPDHALYGGAYAIALRPNGAALIAGRGAGTASDLLAREDLLLIRDGVFTALGGPGNDSIYQGLSSGWSMPLQLTQDGGAILAATAARSPWLRLARWVRESEIRANSPATLVFCLFARGFM